MVHGIRLHRTQPSMLRPCSSPTALRLTAGITPCYSGLQVQGTANSPLGAQEYCIRFRAALQANFSIQTARFYRMDIKHPPMIHRGRLLCFLCCALCGKAGEGPRHQHEQQQYSESYWQKNRKCGKDKGFKIPLFQAALLVYFIGESLCFLGVIIFKISNTINKNDLLFIFLAITLKEKFAVFV